MDVWKHSLLSQEKFGGIPEDYFSIHSFLDSSKLFMFDSRHRLLLHHLLGIEFTITKFGNYIVNSNGKTVMIRDVAAEHCKEDLSSYVPNINDWIEDLDIEINLPQNIDPMLLVYINLPFLRSGHSASRIITFSDFGVFLCGELYGNELANELRLIVPPDYTIKSFLSSYKMTKPWQIFVDKKSLIWLKEKTK